MDDDKIAFNLANNLRQLREARGISQEKMARLAGLPRPTWSNLESGAGNPTLQVLVRVAHALSVSIEELLGPPREAIRLYPKGSVPERKRGDAVLRRLVPDAVPGLELDRLELPASARLVGVPHRSGTREYLACEQGAIELSLAGGQAWRVSAGDVIVFRGDQKHAYRNLEKRPSVAISLVMLAPA